jgi:hypothetical protein
MAAAPAGHARLIMTRAVLSHAIDTEWRLVNSTRPCPVCGSHDACSTQEEFASCSREPSEWKLTNGSWLHKTQARALAVGAESFPAFDGKTSGTRIRL